MDRPTRSRAKKAPTTSMVDKNWSLMAGLWPVEERPEALQDREMVNSMDLNTLLTFHTKYEEKRKREAGAGGGSIYKLDQMPPPQNVEACVDNGMDLLSVVRTYRYPIGDVAHLWAIMPQYRSHVYRTLDLRPHGIDAQIPEAVIGILHDRRILLKLCYFGKINANLATNHLKVRTEHEVGGSSVTTTELDWKELTSIRNVTDAIINFEVALRLVWPADFTRITMMKLLNNYRYCMFRDEKLSVSVIAQFFERVSNGNRKRAGSGKWEVLVLALQPEDLHKTKAPRRLPGPGNQQGVQPPLHVPEPDHHGLLLGQAP